MYGVKCNGDDVKNVTRLCLIPVVVALAACASPADSMAKHGGQKNVNDIAQHAQAANASHVADPLRMAEFSGPGINASINNGFTVAHINHKKATVKRVNTAYYEVSGNGYILSISLNDEGVETASYTKAHSRVHGILQVVQK